MFIRELFKRKKAKKVTIFEYTITIARVLLFGSFHICELFKAKRGRKRAKKQREPEHFVQVPMADDTRLEFRFGNSSELFQSKSVLFSSE